MNNREGGEVTGKTIVKAAVCGGVRDGMKGTRVRGKMR